MLILLWFFIVFSYLQIDIMIMAYAVSLLTVSHGRSRTCLLSCDLLRVISRSSKCHCDGRGDVRTHLDQRSARNRF